MPTETQENAERRDDELERNFSRGDDRNDLLFAEHLRDREITRQRSDELFDARMAERSRLSVSHSDRDGLRFRDAAIHSTAVGVLESEAAVVGAEEAENVPDEEH